jgi:hypothetical protein
MILKSILLAASLCVGLSVAPSAKAQLSAVNAVITAQDATQDITGKLGAYVHSSDGWTYFMLGNVLLKIPTANFPSPNPEFGTTLKATGCVPDPTGNVDFICSGLK